MEDERIVGLFFERDGAALDEMQKKYGALLKSVAQKITGSEADAEECLNDALMNLWEAIPPARPQSLRAYSCRTVRNIALRRLTYNLADKRSANSAEPLDELEAVIADRGAELRFDDADFRLVLEGFLDGLSRESRVVFMKRYFFTDSVGDIAKDLNISESKVKSLLFRARRRLRKTVYREESE